MIILCAGMPGSGKSTLMHWLVSIQSRTHRFFIVDHEAGWGADAPLWQGNVPHIHAITYAGQKLPEKFEDAGVYIFRNWEPFAVADLAVRTGNVVYVDDEIDKTARRKGWDSSGLRRIVHEGRHLPNAKGEICELHIIGACRRLQNLHTDITDIADQFFIFKLKGRNTLKRMHDDSLIDSDEDWDTIRELNKFECYHYPSEQYYAVKSDALQK